MAVGYPDAVAVLRFDGDTKELRHINTLRLDFTPSDVACSVRKGSAAEAGLARDSVLVLIAGSTGLIVKEAQPSGGLDEVLLRSFNVSHVTLSTTAQFLAIAARDGHVGLWTQEGALCHAPALWHTVHKDGPITDIHTWEPRAAAASSALDPQPRANVLFALTTWNGVLACYGGFVQDADTYAAPSSSPSPPSSPAAPQWWQLLFRISLIDCCLWASAGISLGDVSDVCISASDGVGNPAPPKHAGDNGSGATKATPPAPSRGGGSGSDVRSFGKPLVPPGSRSEPHSSRPRWKGVCRGAVKFPEDYFTSSSRPDSTGKSVPYLPPVLCSPSFIRFGEYSGITPAGSSAVESSQPSTAGPTTTTAPSTAVLSSSASSSEALPSQSSHRPSKPSTHASQPSAAESVRTTLFYACGALEKLFVLSVCVPNHPRHLQSPPFREVGVVADCCGWVAAPSLLTVSHTRPLPPHIAGLMTLAPTVIPCKGATQAAVDAAAEAKESKMELQPPLPPTGRRRQPLPKQEIRLGSRGLCEVELPFHGAVGDGTARSHPSDTREQEGLLGNALGERSTTKAVVVTDKGLLVCE